MSALLPLYTALTDRLRADPALMGRVTQVYDGDAPDNAALPFIEIGDATETPGDVFGRAGHEDTVTLHLYSNAREREEVFEVANLLDTALTALLTLDRHTTARMRREFREALREPDRTWHLPVRYRVRTFSSEALP